MWPLTGAEIVAATGGRSAHPHLAGVAVAGVSVGAAPARPDELFVALGEGADDRHAFVEAALRDGAALALVAEAWGGLASLEAALAARCVVVADPLAAFRRLAAALRRRFAFPVVAVGGSNGKTTTKDLLAALLGGDGQLVTKTPETMNGDAGVPWTLCQRAHAAARPPGALVVEIGIDALGAMAGHVEVVDPDVALLTALGVEHLEGLGSWEAGAREELRLFAARPGRRRVVQASEPRLFAWLGEVRAGDAVVCAEAELGAVLAALGAASAEALAARGVDLVTHSISPGPLASEVELTRFAAGARPTRGRFHVPLAGRHAAGNFALAAAAARILGRTMDDLARGLEAFTPPPMRLAPVELANGALLFDDTYNASPASVAAALEVVASNAFDGRPRVVVLGDMLELGAESDRLHRELAPLFDALPGAAIGLHGDATRALHEALVARGARVAWAGPDEDPARLVDALCAADGRPWAEALASAVVLVKASRGMRLERLVATLAARCEPDPAARLAELHAALATACVTGTNGKTTTSTMLAAIVAEAGQPSARVTTLGAWVGGELVAREATADAFLLAAERAVGAGVETLVVETTSQALADGFAARWPARVGVFTNLSHDHLDVHGTAEAYLAAKAQLFLHLAPGGAAVLNAADPASALLDEVIADGVRRAFYAARPVDDACAAKPLALAAREVLVTREGTRVLFAPSPLADSLGGALLLRPIGEVWAEDALGAAVAADALGLPASAIARALAAFEGVPGRFQVVAARPLVVVDFAHTPDALARTLGTARRLVGPDGRLAVVFGCGGDRDPEKRPEMGRIAAAIADEVVVTSDNPRSEDPAAIAGAIVAGAGGGPARVRRILDRASAIEATLAGAAAEDVVVLAGKGHEAVQVGPDGERPFDDVTVARSALRKAEARRR